MWYVYNIDLSNVCQMSQRQLIGQVDQFNATIHFLGVRRISMIHCMLQNSSSTHIFLNITKLFKSMFFDITLYYLKCNYMVFNIVY